jgi:5-methylthioribose kinase
LGRLKVAQEWHAPLSRGANEADWLREVSRSVPGTCPDFLGYDASSGWLVMSDVVKSESWKSRLMSGQVDPRVAGWVGQAVGSIQQQSVLNAECWRPMFANDAEFEALRLEPYFSAAAIANPDVAEPLGRVVDRLTSERSVLVHGDVSPKNVLVTEGHPVLVDAECAVWGHPAFDLAFCLSHLLLKWVHLQGHRDALWECAMELTTGYVTASPTAEVPEATPSFVAALMLARVDGKSPVEYAEPDQRGAIRAATKDFLLSGENGPLDVLLHTIGRHFA